MGIKRLVSPTSVPKPDEAVANDAVKSGQSNSATFAALAGIVAAVAAGISGIIKATGINAQTTTAEAAVIIAVLLLCAVSVIAVAWVLISDYKIRASTTTAAGASATKAPKSSQPPSPALLKVVDEQAELPVLAARYNDSSNKTSFLVVLEGDEKPKWVDESEIKHYITAAATTSATTPATTHTAGG
jgi:hypothetical protein